MLKHYLIFKPIYHQNNFFHFYWNEEVQTQLGYYFIKESNKYKILSEHTRIASSSNLVLKLYSFFNFRIRVNSSKEILNPLPTQIFSMIVRSCSRSLKRLFTSCCKI